MEEMEHRPIGEEGGAFDIKSMAQGELEDFFAGLGEKPFRGRQVFSWLHRKGACSWEEMTDLSRTLREKVGAYPITKLELEALQTSQLDGTQKYLFRLGDGSFVESVLMPYHHGNSVCISSQVGCAMGCRFCASTIGGKKRNLLPSEMLEQVYQIQRRTGKRVDSVVVMGTGEPLDNYENFVRFVRLLTSPEGLSLSQRSVTASTCGIVPNILRLSQEGLSLTLALSLHAPNDELRRELMPVARRYPLKEVLGACQTYFERTGRRITYEYSLMDGVNDSQEQAQELGRLLKGRGAHVNLIPVNPVRERTFLRSRRSHVESFKNTLEKYQINVTIRREMGSDIDGACGQLRARYENK